MSNASVRLPAVEPFELTDPTPPSAAQGGTDAALENELMTDLGALSHPYGRSAAPRSTSPSPVDPAAGRLKQGEPTDKGKWDSLDPDVVARRLAQLRRPQPRPEASEREVRPADPRPIGAARTDVRAAAAPATPVRPDTISRLRPRPAAPAEQARVQPVRPAVQ